MKKLIKSKHLIIVLAIVIIALAAAGSYSWFITADSITYTGTIKDEVIIVGPLGKIEKRSSVDQVQPGGSFEYTIKASNREDATDIWKNVVATDVLDKDLSYDRFDSNDGVTVTNTNGTLKINFGDIVIGGSKEVTIHVTVRDNAKPDTTIKNSVVAEGSNDLPGLPVTDDDPNPPVVVIPSGSITKKASVDVVQTGQSYYYTITATNSGTTAWKNVIATDDLCASGKLNYEGFSIVEGEDITVSESNGMVEIKFGDIAVGKSKTVRINVSVKSSAALGTLDNTVNAASDNHAPVKASYPVTVIGTEGYITKRASNGAVIQGDTYTYAITVGNNDSYTWENVVATDKLDTSLITYTGYTGDQGVTVNNNNGELTIDFGSIEPGTTKTATISVTVNWGVAAGTRIQNSIVATGSNGDGPKTAVDPIQPEVQGTALTAANTSNRVSTTREGDYITYEINVENTGNAPAYDVVANVNIPVGLSLVPGSVQVNGFTAEYSLTSGVLSVNIGNLAIGETVTITYSAYVTVDAIGKSIESTGTVTGYSNKNHGPGDAPDLIDDFSDNNTLEVKLGLLTDHVAYINGYKDRTVRPEKNISRAEATTIVFRLLTDDSRNIYWSKTNNYSDVSANSWYNNAISTMTKAGVVEGYPEGTFEPNNTITRAEFAIILDRLDNYTAYTGANKFGDISGHYAADYINRAAEKGWVEGYEDGTFKPNKPILRSEAITIINRVLGRANIAEMHKDMVKWSDNPERAWYYKAVQEATNSHHYIRDEYGYEHWTSVIAPPKWDELERTWSRANG